MSTPPQETSGPRGLAGSHPTFGQLAVRENHTTLNLALTSLQQIPQEQSTAHQLRGLIVRLSTTVFNIGVNKRTQANCGKVTITAR